MMHRALEAMRQPVHASLCGHTGTVRLGHSFAVGSTSAGYSRQQGHAAGGRPHGLLFARLFRGMRAYAGWYSTTAGSRTCSTVSRFDSPLRVVQSIDLPTGSPIRAVPMGVSTEMRPFEMSASFG